MLHRRHLIAAALSTASAGPAAAARPTRLGDLASGAEVIALWPGASPQAAVDLRLLAADQGGVPGRPDRWLTGISRPAILRFAPSRPNGSAVVLIPGGGYGFLAFDNEGTEQARWLNRQGVTAYVLLYRLPSEGWRAGPLAPLQDAQRAMRVVRARARTDGVDPGRIAVLGFSAGGHLAASLATRAAERTYPAADSADALSARPDLAALVYPVVSLSAPFAHAGSRDKLLGPGASDAQRRRFSVELGVARDAPPSFLVHAGDDGLVPVANSLALYAALQASAVPAELHVFAEGGHGFGARLPATTPASRWPELLTAFARRRGVFA